MPTHFHQASDSGESFGIIDRLGGSDTVINLHHGSPSSFVFVGSYWLIKVAYLVSHVKKTYRIISIGEGISVVFLS